MKVFPLLLGLAAHAFAQEPMPMAAHATGSETKDESRVTLLASENLGPCPTTLEEWKTWRRGKFMELAQAQGFALVRDMNGESQLGGTSVSGFLERCRPGQEAIHARSDFQACFGRIVKMEQIGLNFVEAALQSPADRKTHGVSGFPATYTSENLFAVGEAARPDRRKEDLKAALKRLTAGSENVRVVRFSSAIIDKLESLVILDIRDGKQFWTHFTLGDSPDDFLSLEVDLGKGNSKFQLHGLKKKELTPKNINAATCVQCHRTSPISLVSKDARAIEVHLPEGEGDGPKVMKELNGAIAEVARILPEGVDINALGPPRGPAIKRPIEYLRRLASHTSTPAVDDATLNRIAPQMNCAKCHDPEKVAQSIGHQLLFPAIFEHYVTSGHMPPENHLSPEDRKLLSELISAEYYGGYPTQDRTGKEAGLFGNWLNEPCPWMN